MMSFCASAYTELAPLARKLNTLRAFVGFDGTVDKISTAVHRRQGLGESFDPIPTISAFAARLDAAAGKSTNVELFLKRQKVGGNAAIMASAVAAGPTRTTLVATVGKPAHEVFTPLAKNATLISLGAPTETHAVEFTDGKVMLGYTRGLEAITFAGIEKSLGGRSKLIEALNKADLISLVNWTMIPAMTDIFRSLLSDIFPKLKKNPTRTFFIDLADPEKRPQAELKEAITLLKEFESYGRVVLGLNFKEGQQVQAAFGLPISQSTDETLKQGAADLQKALGLSCVIIHPARTAACATAQGAWWIPNPEVKKLVITTGAGDHFNAGFALAWSLGASPLAALCLGVAYSGYYVGSGNTPSFADALALIKEGW